MITEDKESTVSKSVWTVHGWPQGLREKFLKSVQNYAHIPLICLHPLWGPLKPQGPSLKHGELSGSILEAWTTLWAQP